MSCSKHSWKFRCRKVHAIVARSTLRSQTGKNTRCSNHFWTLKCRFCAVGARDSAPCQKWAKHEDFAAVSKTLAGVGHYLQRCFSRGRRSTRDTWVRHVRRSGREFPEKGCILHILPHQILRLAKSRWFCVTGGSTSYDLPSLFRGRRSNLDTRSGKMAKCIGMRPSALHSTFHFWMKCRRIASFLMLSTSKIGEVLQNCFVFDVFNFKTEGSVAELRRCQLQKFRKSRKIASLLMVSTLKIAEVLQNSFVLGR